MECALTIVLSMLRMLGLPACIILGFLAFYEGVPLLRDIPFADRIPVVREIVAGRVATERAKAAQEARAGYVVEQRATAAEALAKELQRQIQGQQIVIDAYQVQYKNQLAKDAERNAADEEAIRQRQAEQKAAGGPKPGDLFDEYDVDFMRKRQGSATGRRP